MVNSTKFIEGNYLTYFTINDSEALNKWTVIETFYEFQCSFDEEKTMDRGICYLIISDEDKYVMLNWEWSNFKEIN